MNNLDLYLDRNLEVKRFFDFCEEHKINEIEIEVGDDKFSIISANVTDKDIVMSENGKTIFTNDFYEKFHPDNIDNNLFWNRAVKLSKSMSIAPSGDTEDIQVINETSLRSHLSISLPTLDKHMKLNPNSTILEIGPGLGCVADYIKEKYPYSDYYAIDVCPHFQHPKLFKSDGKSIPNQIPNELDIVYSVNVWQHLSDTQRIGYLTDIKKRLSDNGIAIISMFVAAPENIDLIIDGRGRLFGMFTEDGTPLTNFYGQLTEVPWYGQLVSLFEHIGFKSEAVNVCNGNHVVFKLTHDKD